MTIIRHSLFVLPLLGAVACTDAVEPRGQASSSLIGADPDPAHRFAVGICIGDLVAEGQPGAGTCAGAACSGTLIAPNLVLTAHHCLRQIAFADPFCESTFTDDPFGSPVQVTVSSSVRVGNPIWLQVRSALLPPGRGVCSDDVALLILAEPVPSRVAQPVQVDVTRDLVLDPPSEVAIVGRGAINEFLDLATGMLIEEDGHLERRLREHIPFQCAANGIETCDLVDYSSPPSNLFASPAGYLVIGSSVAPGDSGSGVFDQDQFEDERPSVIGVTSAVTFGPDGLLNHGLVTRLDTHREFVLDGMRQASAALSLPSLIATIGTSTTTVRRALPSDTHRASLVGPLRRAALAQR